MSPYCRCYLVYSRKDTLEMYMQENTHACVFVWITQQVQPFQIQEHWLRHPCCAMDTGDGSSIKTFWMGLSDLDSSKRWMHVFLTLTWDIDEGGISDHSPRLTPRPSLHPWEVFTQSTTHREQGINKWISGFLQTAHSRSQQRAGLSQMILNLLKTNGVSTSLERPALCIYFSTATTWRLRWVWPCSIAHKAETQKPRIVHMGTGKSAAANVLVHLCCTRFLVPEHAV